LELYLTYLARCSLTTDWHKFGLRVTCSSRGRNQLCKNFLSYSVTGLGFCEGSKFDHSHWIAMSPLALLELMFRCDIIKKLYKTANINIKTLELKKSL